MIRILTVIGARPQIIKAAALSRAIRKSFSKEIQELILHTGQHYDNNMSEVFFEELAIPRPDYNLNVGSLSHGKQTAKMIEGIEEVLVREHPDVLVTYGDTNSTLAAAVAASKIHVPVVHIEAGLRSFNKLMPEEINRIMCDHASTLLFCPTKTGFNNLINEGFNADHKAPYTIDNPAIYHCGDVMYDNSLFFAELSEKYATILETYNLEKGNYILSTIHRNDNTDQPEKLTSIFEALNEIAECGNKVILPLHPRTQKCIDDNLPKELLSQMDGNKNLIVIPPVSFLEMTLLEKYAKMIVTDSGGVQKEAFFFKKPCIIMRPQTEWVEIVAQGAAIITDSDKYKIMEAYHHFSSNDQLEYRDVFGDGKAAEFICREILKMTQE